MANDNPYAMPIAELKARVNAESAAQTVPPELQRIATWTAEQFTRFQQLCPDFKGSPAQADALVRYLPDGVFPTAEQLRDAHVQAWYRGDYNSIPAEQPDTNPETMPLHELRRQLNGEEAPPPEYSQEMNSLRDDALGVVRDEQDPAWSMPMGELRTAMQNVPAESGETSE